MKEYRTCRSCRQEKEVESFYPVKWGDGLMRVCKTCHNKSVLKRQALSIADGSYAQYHREYRLRKKLSVHA